MGKKKAKDHYVSKTYLESLLNDSKKLWVYDKKSLDVRERGRREVCWEGNGSNNPYFSKSRVVEEYLKIFENGWNEAVQLFSSTSSLSLKDYSRAKFMISGYVAYLRYSTPAAIRVGQNTISPMLFSTLEILKKQGQLPPPPKGFEYLLEDTEKHLRFDIDKKYPHTLGIKAMVDTCYTFFSSPWFRIENPFNDPFITSDNPTCVWRPNLSQLSMIYIPLTTKIAILIKPLPERKGLDKFDPELDDSGYAKKEFISEMNKVVVQSAEQHVISNIKSQGTLALVEEFKNWKYSSSSTSIPTQRGKFILSNLGPAQERP